MNSEYLQDGDESTAELYCCPFCPTANEDNFNWCSLIEQPICIECDQKLYAIFIWPRSEGDVVQLYPPILQSIMDSTGFSYKECRRLYVENEISARTKEVEMEYGCNEEDFPYALSAKEMAAFLEMIAWLKTLI